MLQYEDVRNCIFILLAVSIGSLWLFNYSKTENEDTSGSHNKVDAESVSSKPTERAEAVSIEDVHVMASMGHEALRYKDLWDALAVIDGEGDNVRLLYSRQLRSNQKHGGYKGEWNREHVWPTSYGINSSGIDFTDLHAIFACDVSTNASRGNKFFDGETDRDSWLPIPEMRGDIARAMFYMAARYDGEDYRTVDLKLSNNPDPKKQELGMLDTLIQWHLSDPVDDKELLRNERVKSIQGNSNPFVDDPDLANGLFSL